MTQSGLKVSRLSAIGSHRADEARARLGAKKAAESSSWPKISDQIRTALGQFWTDTPSTTTRVTDLVGCIGGIF